MSYLTTQNPNQFYLGIQTITPNLKSVWILNLSIYPLFTGQALGIFEYFEASFSILDLWKREKKMPPLFELLHTISLQDTFFVPFFWGLSMRLWDVEKWRLKLWKRVGIGFVEMIEKLVKIEKGGRRKRDCNNPWNPLPDILSAIDWIMLILDEIARMVKLNLDSLRLGLRDSLGTLF